MKINIERIYDYVLHHKMVKRRETHIRVYEIYV